MNNIQSEYGSDMDIWKFSMNGNQGYHSHISKASFSCMPLFYWTPYIYIYIYIHIYIHI